jgi:anaerobic magnesium-protoporphyrin IX monomethyl ester cyclase
MIEQMVKGTQRDTMSRILKECAQAGVWNHSFYFFGFPTETMEDAQATINFISAHHDSIHSASPGEFVLERFSPVYLDPARFGVRRILEKPEQDLAIYFDYELASGIDNTTAHNIVKSIYNVFPTKRFFQFYIYDVYRFLYASHLHAQGQVFPLWLEREEAESKKAKRKRH